MNFITAQREQTDTNYLIEKIKSENWVDESLYLVNCNPGYSSRLTQAVNHKLSHLNGHELFPVLNLEFPPKDCRQVWDDTDRVYRNFDKYLYSWIHRNLTKGNKYLFLCTESTAENVLHQVRLNAKVRLDAEGFRTATLYKTQNAPLTPDYFQRELDKAPVFFWQNIHAK